METLDQRQQIHKMYLYTKYVNELKNQLLINKCEGVGLKHCKDSKTFIEYFNEMDDIYWNIYDYNPNKNAKYWLYLIWMLIWLATIS